MFRTSTALTLIALAGLGAGLLAACGNGTEPVDGGNGAPAATDELPAGLFVAQAPDGARGVFDVKQSAQEGDEVVVRGKVGGTRKPFVEGRAALTLANLGNITSCDEMPGEDGCKTPWDFCCDDPKEIVANTVTIQVVGADDRPLRLALQDHGGLAPLRVLVVKGTVGPRPDPAVLVINASAIHVEP